MAAANRLSIGTNRFFFKLSEMVASRLSTTGLMRLASSYS